MDRAVAMAVAAVVPMPVPVAPPTRVRVRLVVGGIVGRGKVTAAATTSPTLPGTATTRRVGRGRGRRGCRAVRPGACGGLSCRCCPLPPVVLRRVGDDVAHVKKILEMSRDGGGVRGGRGGRGGLAHFGVCVCHVTQVQVKSVIGEIGKRQMGARVFISCGECPPAPPPAAPRAPPP